MKKIVSLFLCMIMLIASVCTTSIAALAESDLIGVWNAISAEADGMTMDKSMLEMFGMLIKMTFNEDGTGILEMEGEAGEINWSESADSVEISVEGDSMTMSKNADGTLAGDFGGAIIVFEKGDGSEGEPAEEMSEEEKMMALLAMLAEAEMGEATEGTAEGGLPGVWNAVSAEADGMTMDKSMLEMFGMMIELTLNEDGTGTLAMEGDAGEITWSEGDGVVTIAVEGDSMDMTMNDDGTLSGDFGGAIIVFEKGNGAAEVAPAADVDTAALLGTWFDGDTTNFTIYNDGTCVATDQYGDSWMGWEVVDGVPMITSGFWFDSPLILNEDGTLYVSDGWSVEKTFTFGEGEIRVGSTLAEPTGTVAASSAEEFFGEWKGETMVMESGTFALADMMMVMDLTISADGTVALFDGAMTDTAAWVYADGYMTAADGMIELSLMENGQLCIAQEFNILYLTRADGSAAPAEAPAEPAETVTGDAEGFVGIWNASEMDMGGMVMNVADMGMIMDLTINADGTIAMFDGETTDEATWTLVDGKLNIEGQESALSLTDDGRLCMEEEGMAMYFVKGEATTTPAAPVETITDPAVLAESPVVGEWNDGQGTKVTINADGTFIATDKYGDMNMEWAIENGVPMITGGYWFGAPIILNEDGTLYISDGFMIDATFTKGAAAETPAEAPALTAEAVAGTWSDGSHTIVLNADGTGAHTFPNGDVSNGTWAIDESGCVLNGFWMFQYVAIPEANGTLTVTDGGYNKYSMTRSEEAAAPEASEPVDMASSTVIGTWNDGEDATFIVNPDGTSYLYNENGKTPMGWEFLDGVPTITIGLWAEAPMIINDDGNMYINNNSWVEKTLMPGELVVDEPTASATSGSAEAFIGFWNASTMEMQGMAMNAADLGMIMDLNITEDGKITMYDGDATEEGTWTIIDGVLDVMGEMQLTATEDGRLCMTEEGISVYFVRGEVPVEVPAEAMMLIGEWTKLDNGNMLNVNTDGTVVLTYASSGNVENMTWAVENGVVVITSGLYEYYEMTVNEDDILEIGLFEFGRVGEPYVAPAPAESTTEAPDASDDPYVGTWKACYLATGGLTGDLRSLGITSTLTLNADGTGSIDFPTPETGVWYDDEGIVRFGEAGMPITLMDGGFLKFGSDLAGYIVFSQDETAVWDPSMAAPAVPAATEVPAAPVEPAAPAGNAATDMQALMDRKFVAKTYTAFGQTMDASMLGAEYSVLFHENGTCDFGLAGMVVPNLPWGLQKVATGLTEVDAFVINYYGTMFNAVITDTGFDMDYYGTMTLHFVPAE